MMRVSQAGASLPPTVPVFGEGMAGVAEADSGLNKRQGGCWSWLATGVSIVFLGWGAAILSGLLSGQNAAIALVVWAGCSSVSAGVYLFLRARPGASMANPRAIMVATAWYLAGAASISRFAVLFGFTSVSLRLVFIYGPFTMGYGLWLLGRFLPGLRTAK